MGCNLAGVENNWSLDPGAPRCLCAQNKRLQGAGGSRGVKLQSNARNVLLVSRIASAERGLAAGLGGAVVLSQKAAVNIVAKRLRLPHASGAPDWPAAFNYPTVPSEQIIPQSTYFRICLFNCFHAPGTCVTARLQNTMHALDPHERPPEHIRNVYKKYQKMKSHQLDTDNAILDLERDHPDLDRRLRVVEEWDPERLTATFSRFSGDQANMESTPQPSKVPVYEHQDMPGR